MNAELLKILACPVCYRSLYFMKRERRLVCKFDLLSFGVVNGVPIVVQNKC